MAGEKGCFRSHGPIRRAVAMRVLAEPVEFRVKLPATWGWVGRVSQGIVMHKSCYPEAHDKRLGFGDSGTLRWSKY